MGKTIPYSTPDRKNHNVQQNKKHFLSFICCLMSGVFRLILGRPRDFPVFHPKNKLLLRVPLIFSCASFPTLFSTNRVEIVEFAQIGHHVTSPVDIFCLKPPFLVDLSKIYNLNIYILLYKDVFLH